MKRICITLLLFCALTGAAGQDRHPFLENYSGRDTIDKKSYSPSEFDTESELLDTPLPVDYPGDGRNDFQSFAGDSLGIPRQQYTVRYDISDKSLGTLNSGRLSLSPFSHHAHNKFEGVDMAGYGGSFRVSDNLSLNTSIYFSSGYFGYLVPGRVENVSASLGISANINERLSLHGWGVMSAGSGINPSYMTMTGPARGFGVGAVYKINENISIQGAYQRSYYNGKWHESFIIIPVPTFKWEIKKRR